MRRKDFTRKIKAKGWRLGDALEYWGRTPVWYDSNSNTSDKKKLIRLRCLIDGLPSKNISPFFDSICKYEGGRGYYGDDKDHTPNRSCVWVDHNGKYGWHESDSSIIDRLKQSFEGWV